MKTYSRIIQIVLAMMGGLSLGLGMAQAAIVPVGSASTAAQTVSILQSDGTDVTNTWLPELDPTASIVQFKSVRLKFAGFASITSVSLVTDTAATPTTSRYFGVCTNYGDHADTTPDFSFNTTANSDGTYTLTPLDCGGKAVIALVGKINAGDAERTFTYVIPPVDSNGIALSWRNQFTCPATALTCLDPGADTEIGPSTNLSVGDNLSTFDEFRGFIAFDPATGKEKVLRTNPIVKDWFVHLVTGQCPDGVGSLLGKTQSEGNTVGRTIYPTNNTFLFSPLNGLISEQQFHMLGVTARVDTSGNVMKDSAGNVLLSTQSTTDRWVDRFQAYTFANGNGTFNFLKADNTCCTTAAPDQDRQINKNAVYPLGFAARDASGAVITPQILVQRGIRITECLDTSDTSSDPILGYATWGSPNGNDNAVLFSKRIVNKLSNLSAGKTSILYSTFQFSSTCLTGCWTAGVSVSTDLSVSRNYILSEALKFFTAMEVSHSTILTKQENFVSRTSIGYHNPIHSGDVLDQNIQSTSKGSSITFAIPSIYLDAERGAFKLH